MREVVKALNASQIWKENSRFFWLNYSYDKKIKVLFLYSCKTCNKFKYNNLKEPIIYKNKNVPDFLFQQETKIK